jgi:hypothetical protein
MTRIPDSGGKCLCDSDRQFGSCCKERFGGDVGAWRSVRESEARVMPRIASFALHTWGPELLTAAVREFAHGSWDLSIASLRPLAPVFDSWFAFTWVPDRHEDRVTVPKGFPRRPVALLWQEAAAAGRPDGRMVITAAEDGLTYSPLLIEAVVPGWTLTVRDMLTGRRFRVIDPDISRRALPDEMLLSGILTLDKRSFLTGTASHTVPCDWRSDLRELRECYSETPWPSRRFWASSEWEVFSGYRKACERRPLAQLDTHGLARDPVHLRWQVSASFADALDRLRPLVTCFGDEEAIDEENGPDGEPHCLLEWYEPGPSGEEDDWNQVGYLYLDEGRLAADVPAPALADRLIREVAACAGDVTTLIEMRPCAPRPVHDRQSLLLPLESLDLRRSPGTLARFAIH